MADIVEFAGQPSLWSEIVGILTTKVLTAVKVICRQSDTCAFGKKDRRLPIWSATFRQERAANREADVHWDLWIQS